MAVSMALARAVQECWRGESRVGRFMTQPPSSPQMVLGKQGIHVLTPATQCDSKRIRDFNVGAAAMKPYNKHGSRSS